MFLCYNTLTCKYKLLVQHITLLHKYILYHVKLLDVSERKEEKKYRIKEQTKTFSTLFTIAMINIIHIPECTLTRKLLDIIHISNFYMTFLI